MTPTLETIASDRDRAQRRAEMALEGARLEGEAEGAVRTAAASRHAAKADYALFYFLLGLTAGLLVAASVANGLVLARWVAQ